MSDTVTNKQTLDAYNSDVTPYLASVRPTVDGDIKAWLDRSLQGLSKTAHILEIGSGPGRDAAYIEGKGFTVRRTDAAKSFVDYLRATGHKAELLDVLLDSLGGPYELVLADAVFLHFTPDEFAMASKKVCDALMGGGRFALTLKQGKGEEVSTRKFDMPRYFLYWQSEMVEAALKNAGFSEVEVQAGDDWREGRPSWLIIIARKDASA